MKACISPHLTDDHKLQGVPFFRFRAIGSCDFCLLPKPLLCMSDAGHRDGFQLPCGRY